MRDLFSFALPLQVLGAVTVYSCHFYGSMLWDLFGENAGKVYRSWNTCMKLIGVPLFTGLKINVYYNQNISQKRKKKNYPFRVQGVCRPVDEVAPRCPCNHADGTVHTSTKSQPSSPILQERKYGQQKFSRQE